MSEPPQPQKSRTPSISGSATPSSLPSLSRAGGRIRTASSRNSATLTSDYVGFVCCDNITHHSYDVKPPVITRIKPMNAEIPVEMNKPLNPRYIIQSLRFESQLYSATNCVLELSGNELTHALRSIIQLSNLDEVSFIRSVLCSHKSKFADLMNTAKNSPIDIIMSDQRKWRMRCAGEIQSLSRLSDKSSYKKDLEVKMFGANNIFQLLNWYHTSNSLERREFLCGLISQFDLAATRLFNDIIADGQRRDFLRNLPDHIVEKIIGYLNANARGKLSVVNHAYYQMIDSMKSPADASTVTRLIELDNPMPNVPSFQKAFAELNSRDNFRSGKFCRLTELEGHTGRILCVTMWRNYIASGGSDKTVRVWSVNSGRRICVLTGHQAGIWCLQFFAKQMLLSGSFDSTIRLWSIKRARCLRELKGHSGSVWTLKVDGNFLLSGGQDKMAIVWDACRGEPLFHLSGHKEAVFAVDLSCADSLAVTGSADRTVKLWSLDDGQLIRSITVGLAMSVTAVAYSRGYVAAASSTIVKIFQVEPGKPIIIPSKNGVEEEQRVLRNVNVNNHWVDFDEEHHKRIESLTFKISNSNRSQLDGILITSSKDGLVKYWDLSQKASLQTFKPLNGGVINSVYFDAYRVAVAGDNNKVRVYDFSAVGKNGGGYENQQTKQSNNGVKTLPNKPYGRSVNFVNEITTE